MHEQKNYKTNLSIFRTPEFSLPMSVYRVNSFTEMISLQFWSKLVTQYTIIVIESLLVVPARESTYTGRATAYQFKPIKSSVEYSLYYQLTFMLFIMCIFYTTTFLPYGRFYNRLGGNTGMLLSYLYIFFYLGFPSLKKNLFILSFRNNYYSVLRQVV